MLSHHEIATLILVRNAPGQQACEEELNSLEARGLIQWAQIDATMRRPSLTTLGEKFFRKVVAPGRTAAH